MLYMGNISFYVFHLLFYFLNNISVLRDTEGLLQKSEIKKFEYSEPK